jgi:hypothetical protein
VRELRLFTWSITTGNLPKPTKPVKASWLQRLLGRKQEVKRDTRPLFHFGAIYLDDIGCTVTNLTARDAQEAVDILSKDRAVKKLLAIRTNFVRVDASNLKKLIG